MGEAERRKTIRELAQRTRYKLWVVESWMWYCEDDVQLVTDGLMLSRAGGNGWLIMQNEMIERVKARNAKMVSQIVGRER